MKPIASTYVHIPTEASITGTFDQSSLGETATIRIGDYGENDVCLFFRTPDQLDLIAETATKLAKKLRELK